MTKRLKLRVLCMITAFVVCIVLMVANSAIFMAKEEGFLYYYTRPDYVYLLRGMPTIRGFAKPARGIVDVQFRGIGESVEWSVKDAAGKELAKATGGSVRIPLKKGKGCYVVDFVASGKSVLNAELRFEYVPSEVYAGFGYTSSDSIHLYASTIPVAEYVEYGFPDFCLDKGKYSAEEVQKAEKILRDDMKVTECETSVEKLKKIAAYLCREWHELPDGGPTDEARLMSPLAQFEAAQLGKTSLWCTNMAMIFAFFANCAGVPTRLLGLDGSVDGVKLTGHVFTESYISELQCWAHSDLATRTLFIKRGDGRLLSSLDLWRVCVEGGNPELKVTYYHKGQLSDVAYSEVADANRFYFTGPADLVYYRPYLNNHSLPSKISRYAIAPDPALSTWRSNQKLYLKMTCLYGSVISGAVALVGALQIVLKRFRHKNRF